MEIWTSKKRDDRSTDPLAVLQKWRDLTARASERAAIPLDLAKPLRGAGKPVRSWTFIAVPAVAAKRASAPATPAAAVDPQQQNGAAAGSIKPEQALALVGVGLMQKLAAEGELPWVWNDAEDGGSADRRGLRERLELIDLALRTAAPLSTAEVTYLLGARPGADQVERGGLRARRLGRNVWKLTQSSGRDASSSDTVRFAGFNDGRRRLA